MCKNAAMKSEEETRKLLSEYEALLGEMMWKHAAELNGLIQNQQKLQEAIQRRSAELKDLEEQMRGKIVALKEILGEKDAEVSPTPRSATSNGRVVPVKP